jgi:hypothetical protein
MTFERRRQRAGARGPPDRLALCTVKLPVIWPVPPRMTPWMVARMTLPSSTMAKRRPTLSLVASPNSRAPTVSKVNSMSGCPF